MAVQAFQSQSSSFSPQVEIQQAHARLETQLLRRALAAQAAQQAAARRQAVIQQQAATTPPPSPQPSPSPSPTETQPPAPPPTSQAPPPSGTGILSPAQVGAYWIAAGGPAWAEQASETVAMCESGDNTNATNPGSGAAGLWQILGQVVPGNIYDPSVNAANAVSKFKASGDTWAQWTCQP